MRHAPPRSLRARPYAIASIIESVFVSDSALPFSDHVTAALYICNELTTTRAMLYMRRLIVLIEYAIT